MSGDMEPVSGHFGRQKDHKAQPCGIGRMNWRSSVKVGDLVEFVASEHLTGPWAEQQCGVIIKIDELGAHRGAYLSVKFPRGTVYAHSKDFRLLSEAAGGVQ